MDPISLVSNIHSDIHVVLPTDNLVEELSEFGYILDSSPSPSSSTWTSKSVAKVKRGFHLNVETKTLKGTVPTRWCARVVVHGEVEDHMDGTYTITLIPQTTGPHQLLITLNGQHVQNSPHDLSVLHCLDKKQVIKCPKAPSGIAIHDNGDLYVATACSCIYAFDATGHPKESVGDCELNNGLVFQDEKLSVRSSLTIINNQLYFAGIGRKCVKQLNLDGKGIKVFSHNEASGVLADYECYRIYLSDCNDNKINVLNHNGDAISAIDGNFEHEGEQDFNALYDLALDPLGNIHVAASGSNTIKVFTKEGVYIRKYGDLIDPRGIAIDEEGYSFVTEFEGKCISMFDPQGNKIHTMGVIGKPFGLALDLKTSSLYVCDYGAHIVLKYSI